MSKTNSIVRNSPIFRAETASPVIAEIDRLHELFRKTFKKALPVELYFAQWDENEKVQYGISLIWNDSKQGDFEAAGWVCQHVGEE